MSREIKFRCWSNEEGQYFPVQTVNFVDNKPISVGYHKKGHKGFLHMRSPKFVLEQYTGLKDKNGKEIYEGDIIKQLMYVLEGKERITTWVVRWNNDEFCYDLHRVSGALFGDSMLSACESEKCEVIGNIHENPELLGGENEKSN